MSRRVLVADDSAAVRGWLERELETLGATVSTAADGEAALAMARRGGFDLVITDVTMPRMDGIALCENLRRGNGTSELPIIVFSSRDDEASIERGFAAGASAWLVKTRSESALRRDLADALERTRILSGRRVIVVEDSRAIRYAVSERFRAAGYSVRSASNGEEALDALLSGFVPDVVVSDLVMPVMDGRELCRAMREDERFRAIPFVVVSSTGDCRTLRQLVQEGAAAYLVKPINVEQLLVTVERLLTDRSRQMEAEAQRLSAERSLTIASIASLVQALEARDAYTRGHSDNVAKLVRSMAQRMGLPRTEIDTLVLAGQLHDIGKIGVPDGVLLKNGALDDAERAIVQRHPVIGHEILRPIPSLQPVSEAILAHHERFDGRGYPNGLAGAKIPLWARIIAVADTYDALTSRRPYRQPRSHEEAVAVVRDVRGTQLCPECSDAFLDAEDSLPGE